jgi:hypothetical protein
MVKFMLRRLGSEKEPWHPSNRRLGVWAPQLVWRVLEKRKYFAPFGI